MGTLDEFVRRQSEQLGVGMQVLQQAPAQTNYQDVFNTNQTKTQLLAQKSQEKKMRLKPTSSLLDQQTRDELSSTGLLDSRSLANAAEGVQQYSDHLDQQGIMDPVDRDKAMVAEGYKLPTTTETQELAANAQQSGLGLYQNPETAQVLNAQRILNNTKAQGNKYEGAAAETVDSLKYGLGSFTASVADAAIDASTRAVKEGYKYFGDMTETQANKAMKKDLTFSEGWFDERMDFTALDFAKEKGTYNYNDIRTQLAASEIEEAEGIWGTSKAILSNLHVGPEVLGASAGEMGAVVLSGGVGLIAVASKYSNEIMAERIKNKGGEPLTAEERIGALGAGSAIALVTKFTDTALFGRNPYVNKMLSSILAKGNQYEAKSFLTQLAKRAKRATGAIGKAGMEGAEEVIQDSLQSFTEKYGTKAADELFTTEHFKKLKGAFGLGFIGGATVSFGGAGLGATGDLIKQGARKRTINAPSKPVKQGFDSKKDQTKYSEKLGGQLEANEQIATDLDEKVSKIEEIKANEDATGFEKLSAVQEALVGLSATQSDTFTTAKVNKFGKTEINNLVKEIIEDPADQKEILKEFSNMSLANKLQNILEYGQDADAATKTKIRNVRDALLKEADMLIAENVLDIKFDRMKAELTEQNKKFKKTKQTVDSIKVKETSAYSYEELTALKPKDLQAELKTLSAKALQEFKTKAERALKEGRSTNFTEQRSADTSVLKRIKIMLRGSEQTQKASKVSNTITKIKAARANTKESYDPKLSPIQKVTKYVSDKLGTLQKIYQEEKAKIDAETKAPGTKSEPQSKEAKTAKRNAQRAVAEAINKPENTGDLPMIEEMLEHLNDLNMYSKSQYDTLKKKLDAHKDNIIDAEIIKEPRKTVSKKISEINKLMQENKDMSRNEATKKVEETFKQLFNSNLNNTEKDAIASLLGQISKYSDTAKEFADKQFNKLKDSTKKDQTLYEALKETFIAGATGLKKAATKEGREKTERTVKAAAKKAKRTFSKTEIFKDGKTLLGKIFTQENLDKAKEAGHDIITSVKQTSLDGAYVGLKEILTLNDNDVKTKDGSNDTSMNGEEIEGFTKCK